MRKVGDGAVTLFWHDCWVLFIPFSVCFGRLFNLAVDKSTTVRNIFMLGWGEGGEAWVWMRRLWVWEEDMLAECRLLSDISLQSTFSYG